MNIDNFFADMKRLMSFKLGWSERTTLEQAYTGAFVVVLISVLPMPYDFYVTLRVFICIALYFFFQAILPVRKDKKWWFYMIIGLFILYNPIVPIHIGEKAVWAIINALTIYLLYKSRIVLSDQNKDHET